LRANDDHLIKHATKSTTSRGFFLGERYGKV